MNSSTFSQSQLAQFLNTIKYSTDFSFSQSQLSLLDSTKLNILERKSTISLPEAETKYEKVIASLNKHFNLTFSLSSLYCQYIKLTASNISLCQFVNTLIMLELLFTNFNETVLKINIETFFSEKISIFQIDSFQKINPLDNLFELITQEEESKMNTIVYLIYAFSICDQFDLENFNYATFIRNISLYNKAYFSHASFSLLVYFAVIIYTNLYTVYNHSKNKGDWDSNSLNEIKTRKKGTALSSEKNSSKNSAAESGVKTQIKLVSQNSLFIHDDIPNFYLLDNDIIGYPYTDTIKPLMFQSYLKLFVFAHISKLNIKSKINLTIQNPILLLKTNMNNLLTSSSSSKLFTSQDINMKMLTLTKIELFTKEKITAAFKSFVFNEMSLLVIGFNTTDQIKNIISNYESLIIKSNNFYVQEPVNTVEEYINMEMLLLEWNILEDLVSLVAKNKDIRKKSKISNFNFKFNCFKCNISRNIKGSLAAKEIKLFFNYSSIKEKNLLIYFRQVQNLLSMISKITNIISLFEHFKNYSIGIRLFQNNFRSHQLTFYLQMIITQIVNYVEDNNLKHVTIYEKNFSNYIENLQCFIKDPNEKKKKNIITKFKDSLKKIKHPKFKFLSNYINELIDAFDFIVISEEERGFNLIRTFDDNKIFFILKKSNDNLISTNQTLQNQEDPEIVSIYLYFSNKKEIYQDGIAFLQAIKENKELKIEIHTTLICDKFFLENSILMDTKMKKHAKLLYQNIDDVYMIAKANQDKDKDPFNFDIYIADDFLAVANFHLYDAKNDIKYTKLINDFISILSSCIELILFILKSKDIYIPRFIFIERTIEDKYYSFEYKSCNIFIKEMKYFESLFTFNFKNGLPLFCLISKKENSQFTFSNDNFYDVFLRLFLNLNKVVDDQSSLNEIFMQKIHKNLFFEYYDSFYPIFFSYTSYLAFNDFFLSNNYLAISKNENFDNSCLIPYDKYSITKHKEIYKKKQWMCKKLIIINFNFPSDYAFSNSHLQFFSFRKIEHFLNEIKMKYLVNEKTNHAKQIGYISKKFNKNKKIVDNIVNLAYQNEYMSIYDFDSKVYEEIVDSYLKEKERIKTQKVELRVIQLTEGVGVKRTNKKQSQTNKDCIIF